MTALMVASQQNNREAEHQLDEFARLAPVLRQLGVTGYGFADCIDTLSRLLAPARIHAVAFVAAFLGAFRPQQTFSGLSKAALWHELIVLSQHNDLALAQAFGDLCANMNDETADIFFRTASQDFSSAAIQALPNIFSLPAFKVTNGALRLSVMSSALTLMKRFGEAAAHAMTYLDKIPWQGFEGNHYYSVMWDFCFVQYHDGDCDVLVRIICDKGRNLWGIVKKPDERKKLIEIEAQKFASHFHSAAGFAARQAFAAGENNLHAAALEKIDPHQATRSRLSVIANGLTVFNSSIVDIISGRAPLSDGAEEIISNIILSVEEALAQAAGDSTLMLTTAPHQRSILGKVMGQTVTDRSIKEALRTIHPDKKPPHAALALRLTQVLNFVRGAMQQDKTYAAALLAAQETP